MSRKTIAQLYNDAHHNLGVVQNRKYGNPITDAPSHVPAALERAVKAGVLTEEVARKLAVHLGRLADGEWGLTSGRVDAALRKFGLRFPQSAHLEHAITAP